MPDIHDWRGGVCEGDPQASGSLPSTSPSNGRNSQPDTAADENQSSTSISDSSSGSSPESSDDVSCQEQILRPQGINVEQIKFHEGVFPATVSSHIQTLESAADAFASLPILVSFTDILKAFQSTPGGPASIVTPAENFIEDVRLADTREREMEVEPHWQSIWERTIYDPLVEGHQIGTK